MKIEFQSIIVQENNNNTIHILKKEKANKKKCMKDISVNQVNFLI